MMIQSRKTAEVEGEKVYFKTVQSNYLYQKIWLTIYIIFWHSLLTKFIYYSNLDSGCILAFVQQLCRQQFFPKGLLAQAIVNYSINIAHLNHFYGTMVLDYIESMSHDHLQIIFYFI